MSDKKLKKQDRIIECKVTDYDDLEKLFKSINKTLPKGYKLKKTFYSDGVKMIAYIKTVSKDVKRVDESLVIDLRNNTITYPKAFKKSYK